MRQPCAPRASLLVFLATLATLSLFATRAAAQENESAPASAEAVAPAEPAVIAPSEAPEPLLILVDLREPAVPAEPDVAPEHAVPAEPPIAPEPPPEDGLVFSIGLSGLLSGVRANDEIEVNALTGVDVALRVVPWLYVGARRIGIAFASPAAGDRYAIHASPMVGFRLPIGELLELFGEVGSAAQARFGGQLDGGVGVAPFAGVGARIALADWVSIGLDATMHVPVTDTFLIDNAVLPRGAVWLAGGAGVLFHIR